MSQRIRRRLRLNSKKKNNEEQQIFICLKCPSTHLNLPQFVHTLSSSVADDVRDAVKAQHSVQEHEHVAQQPVQAEQEHKRLEDGVNFFVLQVVLLHGLIVGLMVSWLVGLMVIMIIIGVGGGDV